MDAVELTYWEAFYQQVEPLPEERAELRTGVMTANILSHLTKGKTFNPADYMTNFDEKPKKPGQTIEQMKTVWAQWERHCNRKRKGK